MIEVKLQELTEAINKLSDSLSNLIELNFAPVQNDINKSIPKQLLKHLIEEAKQIDGEQMPSTEQIDVVQQAPVAQMPPAPTFMNAPQTLQNNVTSLAPFNDAKGLIDYVMSAYKSMGPEKGAKIQDVLRSLGYENINDVKIEHYCAIYEGVEKLKG